MQQLQSPTFRTFVGAVFVVLAPLATGCGGEAPFDDELDATSREIVGGRENYSHDAIGRVWFKKHNGEWLQCTGTLVRSTVVLTAAHCLNWRDLLPVTAPNELLFELNPTAGQAIFIVAREAVSLAASGVLGRGDLALVRLSESAPSAIRPDGLASAMPPAGTPMAVWGYGCIRQHSRQGIGVKRSRGFRWGERTDLLCPGDSGGPLINRETGRVVGVNSGYCDASSCDSFGRVPTHLPELRRWIARFGG